MENTGRHLARLARDRFLGGDPSGKRVVILAGSGGNGGGALAAARNLRNGGAATEILVLPAGGEPSPSCRHQVLALHWDKAVLATFRALHAIRSWMGSSATASQARFEAARQTWSPGRTGSQPRSWRSTSPPGSTQRPAAQTGPAVRATATLTLALPKAGLANPEAQSHIAELYLADIGVLPSVYARIKPPVIRTCRCMSAEIVRLM